MYVCSCKHGLANANAHFAATKIAVANLGLWPVAATANDRKEKKRKKDEFLLFHWLAQRERQISDMLWGHTPSMLPVSDQTVKPADDKNGTTVFRDHPSRLCPPIVAGISSANMAALGKGQ